MAATFGDKILDVLELDEQRLDILYNEAERQRWLMANMERAAHYSKSFESEFHKTMKIHGKYIAGHHRKELERLKRGLGGHGSRI